MKNKVKIIVVCVCLLIIMVTVAYAQVPIENFFGELGDIITKFYVEEWDDDTSMTDKNTSLEKVDSSETVNKITTKEHVETSTNQIQNSMPVSSNISITSNIRINGVSVGENGMRIINDANMIWSLETLNSSTQDDSITAILTTYTEDETVHNVEIFNIDVGAGQVVNTEITYQFDATKEYSGKLMIWNSMTNMMPIWASVDFTQTSGVNAYYYNADNRLLQIDKVNGKSLIFTYDNMGNLLSKTTRE